jgi:hypothetical protein
VHDERVEVIGEAAGGSVVAGRASTRDDQFGEMA